MKVVSIDVENPGWGLQPIKLNRLSGMVMLAGKNGAGKTRLLSQLKYELNNKPQTHQVEDAERELNRLISERDMYVQELDGFEKYTVNIPVTDPAYYEYPLIMGDEQSQRKKIKSSNDYIAKLQTSIVDAVETIPLHAKSYTVIDLMPKGLNLKSHKQLTKEQTEKYFYEVRTPGFQKLEQGTLSYISETCSKYNNATHPSIIVLEEDKEAAIQSFESLNGLIKAFLNTSLELNLDGVSLFDLPIEKAQLSNGQKILLQLCVEIHAQKTSLKEMVIFLDEPENHLHPEACIDLIAAIQKSAPDCQLWVATHSIALLSFFDEATLLFLEDGKVSYKGSEPETVFASLIGNEERVGKLQDFISLPSVYAMNKYAAECLIPPEVVAAKDFDDQMVQIRTHLQDLVKAAPNNLLRVLDFGAGKGRLLESLMSLWPEAKEQIIFVAYDKFSDDSEKCKQVIESYYESSEGLYFNKESAISAKYGDNYFDVVILCNVLHEIEPKEWLSLFRASGVIPTLLNANGVSLIVEDEIIPVGEKAHVKGFIVFDTPELRTMFKIKSGEEFLFSDERNNGRLKAHLIPKNYLVRIDADSRLEALRKKKAQSEKEISNIRESGDTSYKSGRKHSFWIQQLANTQLAINDFS